MSDTQTTTNPAGSPSGAAGSGDADFDALAEGFDQATQTKAQPTRKSDPVREWASQQMQREQKAKVDTALKESVAFLREDDRLKKQSERMLRGFLYDFAVENQEFERAFRNRDSDPIAWRRALTEAQKAAAAESEGPDSKLTDDIAAARAAVRGTSTDAPEKPKAPSNRELSRMSDAEFRDYKASLAAGA